MNRRILFSGAVSFEIEWKGLGETNANNNILNYFHESYNKHVQRYDCQFPSESHLPPGFTYPGILQSSRFAQTVYVWSSVDCAFDNLPTQLKTPGKLQISLEIL